MKNKNTAYKITLEPIGVLYKSEAIDYCGGNQELFETLCSDYGLKPVHKNPSRIMYRVEAIDNALREKELHEQNNN